MFSAKKMPVTSPTKTNNKISAYFKGSTELSPPKKKFKLSSTSLAAAADAASSSISSLSSSSLSNEANQLKSKLKNVAAHHFPNFVYLVKSLKSENCSLILQLVRPNDQSDIKSCTLNDSWSNCCIRENDIVHVLVEPNSEDGNYFIDDSQGLIIVNPHFILSGTSIISSLHCLRKSALNYKFADRGANSSYMILGNILHVLFQFAITSKKSDKDELSKLIMRILEKKQIINQLYDAGLDEEFILKETAVYLHSIEKWLKENLNLNPTGKSAPSRTLSNLSKNSHASSGKNLQILDICDIEESIWSPKYGFKGKLDLTVQADIKLSAFKSLATKSSVPSNANQVQSFTIPVELKSGRTTFSAEHEGQVMFYSLLNKEKRQHQSPQDDFGLLLYLKDMNMKFVKINHTCLRGLIQLRNELVYYMYVNRLPELKNEERICAKCPMLTVCSLLIDPLEDEIANVYANSVVHLSNEHKSYFHKWYRMLELEHGDYKQFETGEFIWWRSQDELESTGLCVFDLRLVDSGTDSNKENVSSSSGDDGDLAMDNFYPVVMTKPKVHPYPLNLKPNDMILVSCQSNGQIGISQGFIKSIENDNRLFNLLLDKKLNEKFRPSDVFRVDKINFRAAITLNYTNLSRLMSSEEKSARLRSLIVDKRTPEFDPTLPKQQILANKSIFKKLNQSQQSAIIKTLMARDYLLIKGYPGTGKTTTIASLIAILINLDKKVIFTSFTNSAVDNLLMKIHKDFNIDFVRIGSYDRIHPSVQKYESNILTSHIKSVKEMDEFYRKKKLMATTCSSINHPVFNKLQFDYCVVDEASQVLLTTCLGPLFSCNKFILVGDLEQLPPIIKNKDARILGMDVSLFEWLNCKEGSVELVHQYRMNKVIMELANEFTYEGKLQCVSESIANSCIRVDSDFLSTVKSNEMKKILTESIVFIDTSEIMKPLVAHLDMNSTDSNNGEYKTFNKIESDIVLTLCKIFQKKSDCNQADHYGIIAPYNNQVKLIQNAMANLKILNNIEVNTVDQFQGRDKRMIIMSFSNSLCQSDETKEFEILNDKRRLTVAITRAKEKLILIGSIKCLVRYKPLAKLVSLLKQRDSILALSNLEQLKFD